MKISSYSFIFSIFIMFIIQSCKSDDGFLIKGYIDIDNGEYIYMRSGNHIDSCLISNHSFYFEGFVDYPVITRFIAKNDYVSRIFYLENSNMKIDLSIDDKFISIDTLEGNKTELIMSDLIDFFDKTKNDSNFSILLYNKLDSVFQKNPRNQMCGMILSDIAMHRILKLEDLKNLHFVLDSTTQNRSIIKSIEKSIASYEIFKIGTKFENLSFSDENDNFVFVYDNLKSILLIDFWASWCKPCRESNKLLINIFNKYKNKGFNILGVSLDTDLNKWIAAKKEDGLLWKNSIAKKGWKNKNIRKLNIQYIPSNFLIDENKKIIAINIEPERLEKLLIKLTNNLD